MKKINILCTICARGGSQGVLNKNLIKINNLPLIAHTIRQAKFSKLFNNIIVSSDSDKIINISKKYGAEIIFKRPKKLSTNKSPKIPVIIHALKNAEDYYKQRYDIVIDLDPTSPLRNIADIKKALNIFLRKNSNNLISVCNSRRNPYFNMVEIINNKIKVVKKNNQSAIIRRQDSPIVYDMNASIYIWNRKYLLNNSQLINNKTSIYLMPEERSLDIDSNFDYILTKYILENEKLFK